MIPLLIAYAIALVAALLFTPAVRWLALRYNFVDRPSPLRSPDLKPRLGGLGIYAAFALAVGLVYPTLTGRTPEEEWRVMGLLGGGLLVLVGGIIDDRWELPPAAQLAFQVAAAVLALWSGILIDKITNPLSLGPFAELIVFPEWLAIGVTIFWLVGAMNTVNFLDGVDGLATGVVGVAALVFAIHSWILGQVTIAVLSLAFAGACFGFLPSNFFPARITLGTTGSVFLGYGLAVLAIIGGTKAATLLLVLGIPLIDAGWVIVQRMLTGQSPFRGDRGHLHHRLLALRWKEQHIVLGMYASSFVLGLLALSLSTRLAKLYAIGIMAVVALALVMTLAYLARRNAQRDG